MRKIVLSALFAAGIGLAAMTAAAAAPASPTPYSAVPAASMITPAQVIIVGPRHRYRHRVCRPVRQCWRNRYGRLVCRVYTRCYWRRW
jgi:hypothetical protein